MKLKKGKLTAKDNLDEDLKSFTYWFKFPQFF